MPAFHCTCGEWLLPSDGSVICWFCRAEYDDKQLAIMALEYVPQQQRPIIKSDNLPRFIVERRSVRRNFLEV